jgi:hypothetical protein
MKHVDVKPESRARFLERSLEAIQDTKRLGNGLPVEQVMAMLDEKLRLARQMQLQAMQAMQAMQAKRAYFPID